ncbi:MAG: LacI family DNA-binding transcriptional regulator [Bacillota bacterium]
MNSGENLTIKDIAEECGVSISTVSRVLNDKPDVKEATRLKVREVIEKENYRPNTMARSLVLNQTFSIGLIIPDINNPFFPEVARGIEDYVQKHSYSVIFSSTDNNSAREQDAIDLMLEKRVDGLIISLSLQNREAILNLEEQGFPVVQLDRNIPESSYPTVMVDNRRSAYQAVTYLQKQGYRNIAHITGDIDTLSAQQRAAGYKQAVKEAGKKVNEEYIVNGDYSRDSGYRAMKALLRKPINIEAVFAANDMMALGAYQACREQNINIPDDLAMIGHDNISIANLVDPPLATMAQPKYTLGRKAAQLLLQIIEIQKKSNHLLSSELPEDQILSTQLVPRNSAVRRND